ncbi:hypothetical protein M758_3G092300 [Ceratodon purpureus]|nr:hypothetical protein M758_3G092300 [Ceratodon purpureus]
MMLAVSEPCDEKKVMAPSSKESVVALPSGGEPVQAEVEYVLSEDLKDLTEVDCHLQTLVERLESKEWLIVLEALTNVRQLAIFHTELMLPILDKVVALVTKSMKNPRSALCKTAIMSCADIFKGYPEHLIDILDPLLLQLLLKASQDKRFVCEEAEKSLEVMTTHMAPQPLLQKIQPYVKHFNPKVRAKASVCFYNSASRLGIEGIEQIGLESLLQTAAAQLNDRLPEAREAARKLLLHLHGVCSRNLPEVSLPEEVPTPDTEVTASKQDPWEQYCFKSLPAVTAQAVLRVTCVDS